MPFDTSQEDMVRSATHFNDGTWHGDGQAVVVKLT